MGTVERPDLFLLKFQSQWQMMYKIFDEAQWKLNCDSLGIDVILQPIDVSTSETRYLTFSLRHTVVVNPTKAIWKKYLFFSFFIMRPIGGATNVNQLIHQLQTSKQISTDIVIYCICTPNMKKILSRVKHRALNIEPTLIDFAIDPMKSRAFRYSKNVFDFIIFSVGSKMLKTFVIINVPTTFDSMRHFATNIFVSYLRLAIFFSSIFLSEFFFSA